jgi:hypothetical protein
MPEFGTENRWLSLGYDLAEMDYSVCPEGILRLSVSAWFAAKVDAFEQRGRADAMMSQDLEDIVTLLVGRSKLMDDLDEAPLEFQQFIGSAIRSWYRDAMVWDAMDGCCVSGTDQRFKMNRARDAIRAARW